MSVDSIADLSDNSSKLLEALQLSHPHELDPRRSLGKKKMLSLNPITWQVPRIVDRCCKHIETYGKYRFLSSWVVCPRAGWSSPLQVLGQGSLAWKFPATGGDG